MHPICMYNNLNMFLSTSFQKNWSSVLQPSNIPFFRSPLQKISSTGGRLAEVWMAHSRVNTPAPRHTGLMALEGKHTFGHDSQNGSSCNNHPHKSSHMTVSSLNILGLRQNLLLFDEAYLWLRGRQVLFQDAFSSIRRQQISPKFLLRPLQHPRSPTGQQPWVLWTIWWYFRAFGVIKLTNKTNAAARNRAVMKI